MRKGKLRLLVSGGCFATVLACLTIAARAQSASQTPTPKKAEEQFKNIQVLKGVPADQLFPTMQFIAASLGVECDFCHVQGAFDKDDKKPKLVARKMMEMMYSINADSFDGHRMVTCNSCHRGSVHPVSIPAVLTEESKEEMAAPAKGDGEEKPSAGGPSPDQLLDRYVQAIGGAAAINNVTSRVMKGTIDFGGRSLPIDIYCQEPDQRISFTHMQDGDNITAFNGEQGWLSSPGHPIREMHGYELDGASIDADLHLATHFKQMFGEMRLQGIEKVNDRDAYVITGQRPAKTPVLLYFDTQSGLLLRLVRYGDTALGWLPTEIDYADYRDQNGLKVPFRWTLARPGGRFTIQVNEMKQNVPVDGAKFVKPASPPESAKPPGK